MVAVDQMPLFHLAVPCEVFGTDRTDMGVPLHEVRVVAAEPNPLRSSSGVVLDAPHGLSALNGADLVYVPWWRHHQGEQPPAELVSALVAAHAAGSRIAGPCGGAFVLAAAGLLDGRRATTHWHYADKLARQYPRVLVDARVLYVDEGDVLTAAGTAAGIDLCLHLLRQLEGAETANTVARRMVVPPHRGGGQAQFVETPLPARSDGEDPFAAALEWAVAHLAEHISIDDLAQQALMGRRTFTRTFRQVTGTSVLEWLLRQRIALAQRLLETTDLPVERVAREAGFGSPAAMRTHFQRSLGTAPSQYRRTFSRSRTQPFERMS